MWTLDCFHACFSPYFSIASWVRWLQSILCYIQFTNLSAWSLSFIEWNFYLVYCSQIAYETCLALFVEVLVLFFSKFPKISEFKLENKKIASSLTSTVKIGYSYKSLSVYTSKDLVVWVFDMKFSPFRSKLSFYLFMAKWNIKEIKTWLYLIVSGG